MKGLLRLFSGLFATFAFSWIGLALIPNFQIGHLDPQTDEEGGDVYPLPQSGMAERGRHIYTANGCFYCHSQQLRPDYAASDLDRVRDLNKNDKWGTRRSAPRDYLFDRPVMLGKERTGPDLASIGKSAPESESAAAPGTSPAASPGGSPGQPAAAASPSPAASPAPPGAPTSPAPAAAPASPAPAVASASPPASAPSSSPGASAAAPNAQPTPSVAPNVGVEARPGEPIPYSAAWHHQHLYSPRSINLDSTMPAYRFLYDQHRIAGERSADALHLVGSDAPPEGWEIIPSYDAKCLVAFLMSRDQSHPLKEVKSAASTAPATAASPPAKGAPK